MSETHTPGPWALHHRTAYTVVGPDGSRTVATCGGYQNNQDAAAVDAENRANARLIASAPKMLEALKEADALFPLALGSIATHDAANSERCIAEARTILARISGAIAQAEGKA